MSPLDHGPTLKTYFETIRPGQKPTTESCMEHTQQTWQKKTFNPFFCHVFGLRPVSRASPWPLKSIPRAAHVKIQKPYLCRSVHLFSPE